MKSVNDMQLNLKWERLQRDIQSAQEELSKYAEEKRIIFEMKDNLELLGHKKAELKNEIEKLNLEREKITKDTARKRSDLFESTKLLGTALEKLNIAENKESAVYGDMKSLDKKIAEKKNDLNGIDSDIKKLRLEQREISKQIVIEKNELRIVQNEILSLKETIKKLKKQEFSLKDEANDILGKINSLLLEKKKLEETRERINNEINELQSAKTTEREKKESYCLAWEEKLNEREYELSQRNERLTANERQLGAKVISLRQIKEKLQSESKTKIDIII